MQDRFRFRVWNGTEMHYNDFVVTATGFVGKITEEFLGQCVFRQDDLTADSEFILMQCTGLKDKKRNLIYEHDILKTLYTKPNGEIIKKNCVVEYNRGAFWINYGIGASYLYNDDCIYEVIGNIYENKELFNEKI